LVSGLVYLVEVQLHLICVHEPLFVTTIKTAANTLEKWGKKGDSVLYMCGQWTTKQDIEYRAHSC